MANRLENLLARVEKQDPALAKDLREQIKELSSRRSFGLNFEQHVPETVELHGRRIRRGDKVRFLAPRGSTEPESVDVETRRWRVIRIKDVDGVPTASLIDIDGDEETTRAVEDLVVVADFRDPIYPGLRSTGKVERGGDKPFHTVINAENYHALQALMFAYEGKVDAIYIDPPYNSRRARLELQQRLRRC